MAGMFYSIEEAAEKLNKSIEQVEELVEQRKLREFRDGNKVLFKVDEVESLMADTGLIASQAEPKAEETDLNIEDLDLSVADETQAEPAGQPEQPEPSAQAEPVGESEELEPLAQGGTGEDLSLESDLDIFGEDDQPKLDAEPDDSEKTELSLSVDDEQGSTQGLQLTNEDTATTQEGINVLDQTDSEYSLTEDTQAETKAMEEASTLEDIESDVNLDSFGSGSGLLDLSLQADDTSLGGILDEIYTPEGGEEEIPAAGASAADVAAEAEQMMAGEQAAAGPAIMAGGYVEPEPDLSSNVFGFVLLIPLAVIIYGLIATLAGQFGILPSVVPHGMMSIYILGGLLVVGLILSIYGYMAGAPAKPKAAKPKKAKKEKPKKVKKEKPKKEKKKKK